MFKNLVLTTFIVVTLTSQSFGALVLTGVGVAVNQNFDSLGTNITNLSSLNSNGWESAGSVGTPQFVTGSISVSQAHSSSATFTTGGTYNFGGTSSDRALGAMTSGAFASPNHIMLEIANQTGSTITQLNYGFDWERFRINTAAASGTFFASSTGLSWSAVTQGDSGAFTTGASSYGTPIGSSIDSISKVGSITGLSIGNGQNFYLRWTFNTVGANSQAIAIDNFTVTGIEAVPEPSSMALVAIFSYMGLFGRARLRRNRGTLV